MNSSLGDTRKIPAEFVEHLASRGIMLTLRGDKLFAAPAGQLRPLEVLWVKAHRAALIAHLAEAASSAARQLAQPDEGRAAALAAFDADCPTAFDGTDPPRVLLRWPDQPGWLVLPQPVLDSLLAWSAGARERAGKAAGRTTRKPERKASQKALYAPSEEAP